MPDITARRGARTATVGARAWAFGSERGPPGVRRLWLILVALLAAGAFGVVVGDAGRSTQTGSPSGVASASKIPAGLQAAIDRKLGSQQESSPGGVSLAWGKRGAVSFASRRDSAERMVVQPVSLGRSDAELFRQRSFVFGAAGVTEDLGGGTSVSYRDTKTGFEQRFRVTRRVPGNGSLVLAQRLSGGLRAVSVGHGAVDLSDRAGRVLSYEGLRVTDASGRLLSSALTVTGGQLRIVIDDRGAKYPLTVDPSIQLLDAPVATLNGTGTEQLGYSVAVSADGQTALVGANQAGFGDGAAYVYTMSGGAWSSTPSATLTPATSGEQFGYSVSLSADGQTAVIGANQADGQDGAVHVYAMAGGSWSNTPTETTLSGTGAEQLGTSVAVSGDGQTLVAGAVAAGGRNGAAYVYTESGGAWSNTPAASFPGVGNETLGAAVAISADGQTVMAGGPYGDSEAGWVSVYEEPDAGWSTASTAINTLPGVLGGGLAGDALALSADGQIAVVGASNANNGDGAAYVYAMSGGSWSNTPAESTLTGSAGTGENFGTTVAVSGDGNTAFVGAPLGGNNTGAAYVYALVGGSSPDTPVATLLGTGHESLGSSVAASSDGQTLLAGAPTTGSNTGAVQVYGYSAGGWSPNPAQTYTDTNGNDAFGSAVAISADGQTAVVGADDADTYDGEVSVYTKSGGAWSSAPVATWTGSGGQELGTSVAVSADGQTVVVGAAYTDVTAGAAYVYSEQNGAWSSSQAPAATLPGSGNETLGSSVAISADGQTVVAGLPNNEDGGGSANVYTQVDGSWANLPVETTFPGGSGDTSFGLSVAVSGDGQTVAVGAPGAGGGLVLLYVKAGGAWSGSQAPAAMFPGAADDLGRSVALSADGQTLVAGGPGAGITSSGLVNVYDEPGGGWAGSPDPVATFYGTGEADLGASVGISADGQTLVAGGLFGGGDNGGEVYVYQESAGTWASNPVASWFTSDANAELGTSSAISGDGETVLTGAPGNGNSQGAVGAYEMVPTTTTTAGDVDTTYSASSQLVAVGSAVSSSLPATSVDEGSVTFALLDSSDNVVGTTTTGAVSGGSAGVAYPLPAGLAAGIYTIDASYTDDTGGYADSADGAHTVTVEPASQTIAFTQLSDTQTVGTPAALSASGGASGEPVEFSVDPSGTSPAGACVVSQSASGSGTLSFVEPGTCEVQASQGAGASGNYAAAATESQSVNVDAAPITTTTTPTSTTPTSTTPTGPTPTDTTPAGTSTPVTKTPPAKPVVVDPRIVAHLSSAKPKTKYGWYRTPVRVRFVCTAKSAPLTGACPTADTLTGSAAGQSVRRTITATDGGHRTLTVSKVNIDQVAPKLTGVRDGATYGSDPTIRCTATRDPSGIAGCRVHLHRTGGSGGLDIATFKYEATATDRAGNTSSIHGSYRVLDFGLLGAARAGDAFLIRPGTNRNTYTIVVNNSASRPQYLGLIPALGTKRVHDNFHAAGHDRWTLAVKFGPGLLNHFHAWGLGVTVAGRIRLLEIRTT